MSEQNEKAGGRRDPFPALAAIFEEARESETYKAEMTKLETDEHGTTLALAATPGLPGVQELFDMAPDEEDAPQADAPAKDAGETPKVELAEWIQTKLAAAETSLKWRIESEESWRTCTDAEDKAASMLAGLKRMSKADRLREAEIARRTIPKAQREVEMWKAMGTLEREAAALRVALVRISKPRSMSMVSSAWDEIERLKGVAQAALADGKGEKPCAQG